MSPELVVSNWSICLPGLACLSLVHLSAGGHHIIKLMMSSYMRDKAICMRTRTDWGILGHFFILEAKYPKCCEWSKLQDFKNWLILLYCGLNNYQYHGVGNGHTRTMTKNAHFPNNKRLLNPKSINSINECGS